MKDILKQKKVLIYGISTETERVLDEWNGNYNVIGLLDGFRTSGEQFGYSILDINDVIAMDDIAIVVVARPGSCRAIAKRIGALCREHDVPLFDIRGNNLLEEKVAVYDFSRVCGYTRQELISAIYDADVVSFDLFDTLAVRNISSFEAFIALVEGRLREQGICITDFVQKRIRAEKKLSVGRAPRLSEIYAEVIETDQFISPEKKPDFIDMLVNTEFSIDKGILMPRRDMVDLVNELVGKGKQVYVTSDSYYSKSQITEILNSMGVNQVTDVLVSCEYNTAKTDNLFDVLKECAGTENILHIGDDIVADVESAKKHEIDSYKIYSAAELLELAGGLNITEFTQSLSDQIRVGMFAANIFNSPFQFEDDRKRIHVNDARDIGYLFCAPMIMDFTRWFEEETIKFDVKNKWLCARDGYLISRLYEMMYPSVHTDYVYTSRISAIRAGMDTIDDIRYVDGMKFSGSLEENLRTRFGIDEGKVDAEDIDSDSDGLLKYAKSILKVSEQKRYNNLAYIDKLDVKDGSIAFFDFVAKGTSQLFMQKLVGNPIKGLYFLQLEPQFMKDWKLDIKSFYTEDERETSAIFENYYILETLLTSPESSIDEFDENGAPIFANETRTDSDILCFMRAQDGIVEYVKKYISICPESERNINKKLDEQLLLLLRNVEIRDNDFLSLTVEDPFFNRMTAITDVM